MATKTLSVDEEAYRILTKARKTPTESFSKVIKRATWNKTPRTCGDLLRGVTGIISDETLEILYGAQENDTPPVSKWNP